MSKASAKDRGRSRAVAPAGGDVVAAFVAHARAQMAGEGPDIDQLVAEAASLPATQLAPALALLAREGQERALPFLAALARAGGTPASLAAVAALGEVHAEAAATTLLPLAGEESAKEVRKEARRALFRLRAAGVAVPEAPREDGGAPRREVVLARASTVDGAGSRLVALAVEGAFEVVNLVMMVLNDERGVVDGAGLRRQRSDVAEPLDEVVSRGGSMVFADVPADYVRQALREAHEVNRRAGVPVPPEYYRWAHVVGEPETHFEREPVYDEVSLAAVRWNPQLLEESYLLLQRAEMRSWWLPEEELQQAMEKASRARESALILPGQAQEDPQQRMIERLVVAFFGDAVRLKYKRRLEQNAYIWSRLGRSLDARMAIAAALALDPASGTPLSRQPFVLALTERTVASLTEERKLGRERSSGLVLP